MKKHTGTMITAALLLIALFAAAAVFFALQQRNSLAELDAKPAPVTVPVQEFPLDYGANGSLSVHLGDTMTLISPFFGGTVTGVHIQAGQEVRAGDTLFTVDGVAAIAYSGSAVFYRSLSQDMTGSDVTALQNLLRNQFGYRVDNAAGYYGWSTGQAVRELSKKVGAGNQPVFSPAWLVRLPADPFLVTEVNVELGGQVPGRGAELAMADRAVTEVVVNYPGIGGVGEYQFRISGRSLSFTQTEEGWQLHSEEDLAALISGREPSNGVVQLDGYFSMVTTETALGVPGAAILSAESSGTAGYCVIIGAPEDADKQWKAVSVEPLGTTAGGVTLVRGQLAAGDQVVLNPQDLSLVPECR